MATGTLETVKERSDIVEIVGQKVQLRPMGRNFKGLCPFHQEKTPSFVVYPESQSFHCFGCGKSGDVFTWTMLQENVDFRDALKLLAERAGVELQSQQRRRDPEQDRERERLIDLNERAAAFFSNLLWTSSAAEAARAVLDRRGVDRRTAERFGLGFAPDPFDALKSHLLARDATEEELLAAGLLSRREEDGRTWDRFRNRLTFPIRDRDGRAVGFGARALADGQQPKYLNTAQTAIFDKRSLLYLLDRAYDEIRRTRTIVIVEGYMDAIAAHQHGYENVVASMGTALTPTQVSSIRRYVDRVYLALDSDAAGQLATLRGIEAMRDSFADDERVEVRPGQMVRFERTLGAEIRVVLLPHGKDPDEFIRANPGDWPYVLEAAVPLVEFFLTRTLSDVEPTPYARAKALQEDAVPILKEIGDPAVLSHYVGLTARLLGFKDTDVHAAVLRGPRKQTRQSPARDPVLERPSARDPERLLVSLVLKYPQAALSQLHLIDRDDVIDIRHRELLDAIWRTQGDTEAAIESVPEEIAVYARELLQDFDMRSGVPIPSSREIPQAIQRLGQVRYDTRLRQVQADLQAARQEGDEEGVAAHLHRLTILAQRKSQFDPRQSPYFRDLRTESV